MHKIFYWTKNKKVGKKNLMWYPFAMEIVLHRIFVITHKNTVVLLPAWKRFVLLLTETKLASSKETDFVDRLVQVFNLQKKKKEKKKSQDRDEASELPSSKEGWGEHILLIDQSKCLGRGISFYATTSQLVRGRS